MAYYGKPKDLLPIDLSAHQLIAIL
jgi:hypothetical protein